MRRSEVTAEIAKALSLVQKELRGAEKNAENPHFRAGFANLESVWDSIRGPLAANNLSVSQLMGISATGQPTLITMLMHSSGEWISGEQLLLPIKQDPQALGSAITYARRYGLAAIIGQIQTDDDGEDSVGRGKAPKPPATPPQSPKAPFRGMSETMGPGLVTEPQLKRLFAIQKKHGVTEEFVREHIKTLGFTSTKQLNRVQYDELIRKIETQ